MILIVTVLICCVPALRGRCGVGCEANMSGNSGIPYPADGGLKLLKALHLASHQHVAGLLSGPEHGHEWMMQMTGVAGRWTHQWPVTDGIVAEAH